MCLCVHRNLVVPAAMGGAWRPLALRRRHAQESAETGDYKCSGAGTRRILLSEMITTCEGARCANRSWHSFGRSACFFTANPVRGLIAINQTTGRAPSAKASQLRMLLIVFYS